MRSAMCAVTDHLSSVIVPCLSRWCISPTAPLYQFDRNFFAQAGLRRDTMAANRTTTLMADLTKNRDFTLPYEYPTQRLVSVELPSSLSLTFLEKY